MVVAEVLTALGATGALQAVIEFGLILFAAAGLYSYFPFVKKNGKD